jgi:hypothetical protein
MFINNMPPPLIGKIDLISISIGYGFFHSSTQPRVNSFVACAKV